VPTDLTGSVHDLVCAGLRTDGHEEDWEREVRLENLLERLELSPAAEFSALSGGLKRRTLLARALAGQPDLLLLDEPTNHLDLESILWLEEFLLGAKLTLFFVTHDRVFLRQLADPHRRTGPRPAGQLGLRLRHLLGAQGGGAGGGGAPAGAVRQKLAQEEAWIRRGVRAQRSRAQSRINQLMQMRAERSARRDRTGNVTLRLAEAERSGVKVIETENLSFAWPDGRVLVRDLTRSSPAATKSA